MSCHQPSLASIIATVTNVAIAETFIAEGGFPSDSAIATSSVIISECSRGSSFG
jgi:hypothetical protein